MQIRIAENHKLRVKVIVTQLCLTLCNPMDWLYSSWNSPGQNTGVGSLSLLQGIFSTQGQTQVSCIAGGFFTSWAIREAQAQGETPLFFSNIVVSGLGVCLNMPERFPGCKMNKRMCAPSLNHVQLFCYPMDCSPPDLPVHGISQARVLKWVAIYFSNGSSQPRDWTCVSCFGRQILYHWTTREALNKCIVTTYYFSEMQWELASPLYKRSTIIQQMFINCFFYDSLSTESTVASKVLENLCPQRAEILVKGNRRYMSNAWDRIQSSKRHELIYKTVTDSQMYRIGFWFPREMGEWEEMNWEFEVSRCKLGYI